MLLGNLMDYVGRKVQRKSDGKIGKITGLVNGEYAENAIGLQTVDDQVFELEFTAESVVFLTARTSVIQASDYKIL